MSRIIGASRLRRKLERLPIEIRRDITGVIAEEGFGLRDTMARRAPVSEEGLPNDYQGKSRKHLRDALEARISKSGLRVRVGLIGVRVMRVFFFARYLEFGTRKMAKRPFMFPAWRERKERVRARVKEATVNAFQRVTGTKFSDV